MIKIIAITGALALITCAASAHHGWGSYDAAHPVTVNGPTDLKRISMIGTDLALDPGRGTCGKNGQGVPVGVGQPTLRMERITVGGTG